MENSAQEKLYKAIEVLADKITEGHSLNLKSDDALKYTQAALNAANTIFTLSNKDR